MNKERRNSGFITRVILTVILCIAAFTGGAIFGVDLDDATRDILGYCVLGGLGLALIIIVLNAVFARLYKKSKSLSIREGRKFITEKIEEAEKNLKRATVKIVMLRIALDLYSAFILLFGLGVAFCIGAGQASALFTLFPAYLILGFFNRIQLASPIEDFNEYASEEDYPTLYSLAYKAQSAVNMKGKIKILIVGGTNAGISKIGKAVCIYVGIGVLNILNEDELYQVLIHEFSHRTKDGDPKDREYRLFTYINESEETKINFFCNKMFIFLDLLYTFEYMVYKTVASRSVEYIADKAIVKVGNPEIAASALTKLAYDELFSREIGFHMTENFYAPEEKRRNTGRLVADSFRNALEKRKDFWDELIANEIQPLSSTHPIVRNRIDALGVTDVKLLPFPSEGEYYNEIIKATEFVDESIYKDNLENYKSEREEAYLKPLSVAEDWLKDKRELSPEDARPVMDALLSLSMYDELYELCDRIIASSDNKFLTAHAYMMRGRIRLLNYDNEGINDIYTAIDANSNYIEDGLNLIGEYCCVRGLENELNEFRERSMDIQQYNLDVYSKASELSYNDNLIPDTMPKEMLDSILDFIKAAGGDAITHVYLVRKQITDTFFASVFVIRFENDTEDDVINDAMDKIFYHLDTRPEDWHFALHFFDAHVSAAVHKVEGSCVYSKS